MSPSPHSGCDVALCDIDLDKLELAKEKCEALIAHRPGAVKMAKVSTKQCDVASEVQVLYRNKMPGNPPRSRFMHADV